MLAVLATATESRAQNRSRVVLISAATDDDVLREAGTRLQAELNAAGFDVVRIERAATEERELRALMERAARDEGAFAAATISRAEAGAEVDLWIVDRVTDKTVIRTIEDGGTAAPSVLAVRAVELLQASLLEATAARSARDAPPAKSPPPAESAPPARAAKLPQDVARWLSPPLPRPGILEGVAMEAGAVMLQSAGGIGPAVGPMLRLSFGAPRLAGRLTVAGPAVAPALAGAFGTLSVRQELALLELVYVFPGDGALVPVLSAGAGAYHLYAAGDPIPPYQAATGDVWSVLAGAGAGAGLRLSDRTTALADLHVLLTEPRPVVKLAGEELGTAGRPTVAFSLGILTRL